MSEEPDTLGINLANDAKLKMLVALTKKQKINSPIKSRATTTSSKIGAGQKRSSVPKMHRRKSGST